MTDIVKNFVEKNIDLIESNDFEELFRSAPPSGLGEVLHVAEIPFLLHLNRVPDNCFFRSNISNINIPSTVNVIGYNAFAYCSNLESVNFSDNLVSILSGAFKGCPNLTSVVLPEGLDYIGPHAFYANDNLKNISIPSSVSLIDTRAFGDCFSNITIKYKGTKTQWRQLISHSDAFKGTYYNCDCLDGTVVKKQRG